MDRSWKYAPTLGLDKKALKSANTYSRFQHLFMWPVVHADANPSQTEEVRIAPPKLLSDEEVNAFIASEDGATRVKNLFQRDSIGSLSPDMKIVLFGAGQASFLTFLLGCWIGSKQAGEYYVYRHQAAKYETRFKAMRSYYDAVLVGSVAHGFRYAVKIGSFTTCFMLTSQCIASYRNKTSPLEYTVGGAVTGAVLRLTLGVRGMVAGGVLGGLLGLTGGLILWGAMSSSNERQQDRYFKYVQEILLEKRRLHRIQEASVQHAAERNAKSEAIL